MRGVLHETRLSRWCDNLIYFLGLAAVVVAPLFIDLYTENVDEPNKAFLMRSIATVMAVAWLVRRMELSSGIWSEALRKWIEELHPLLPQNPLALPAALFAAVTVLASLTSVFPYQSWFGDYHRRQGAYTALSYVVIFFALASTLRHRERQRRVVTVILLTSLPVSLYAVFQHCGWDPVTWSQDSGAFYMPIATQGNRLFLAAYLVILIPLTVSRLLGSVGLSQKRGLVLRSITLALSYGLLLAVQLTALLFTQSRGPWLAIAAGLFVFFLLLAAVENRRKLLLSVLAVGAAFALLVVLLNVSATPLQPLKGVSYIERLSTGWQTAGTGRFVLWEGAVALLRSSPVRALVGYGPEAMIAVFYPYQHAEFFQFASVAAADRAHNYTYDLLITRGALGLVAWLLLITALLYVGLRELGLIASSTDKGAFVVLWALGGLVGAVFAWLWEGEWRLAGATASLGVVAGLVTYVFVRGIRADPEPAEALERGRKLLLIGILAALVSHFVEIQSGIALVATRVYFWALAALLARVSLRPASIPSRRRDSRDGMSALPSGLLSALILITLAYDFFTIQFRLDRDGLAVLVLMLLAWGLGAFWFRHEDQGNRSDGWQFSLATYVAVSLGILTVFALIHSQVIRSPNAGKIAHVYYLFLFALSAAAAAVLSRRQRRRARVWEGPLRWTYPLLAAGGALLIIFANLRPAEADVYFKIGKVFSAAGRYDQSVRWYQRAAETAPRQDLYHLWLGIDAGKQIAQSPNPQERAHWFETAKDALRRAQRIDPYEPDHPSNLGVLYENWAAAASMSEERAERLRQALTYYETTFAMSPNVHGPQLEEDMRKVHLALGTTYEGMGQLERALTAYQKARDLTPKSYLPHEKLAALYDRLGQRDRALAEARRAWELAPASQKSELETLLEELGGEPPAER